ncbi:MAG: translocation/assembly module TamB domain-containing protein [Nitrospiraceae bacterium]|nr:translocation/assembly module TamB domain-containing protein [Nitrospiraceae bacterium]
MDDPKRNNVKRFACLISLAVLIGVAAFVLRGPYISNAMKRLILPELELMSGRKVIAQRIYINLFPLFIEAKGLKMFDDGGTRVLVVPEVKAYVELSGLPARQIKIRRLVLKDPEISTDRAQTEAIVGHVKAYLAKERDTSFKVKVLAVEIRNGQGRYLDADNKAESVVAGFGGELLLGDAQRIRASAKKITVRKEGWPELAGSADINLAVKDDRIRINDLVVRTSGSTLKAEGTYEGEKADLRTDIRVAVETVKKIFGLSRSGEGEVAARGLLRYAGNVVSADLKVDGKFPIQTLMEVLKVKEKIEGVTEVHGSVTGPLNRIKAEGSLVLTDGNLFDVEVKRLACAVAYGNGLMRFTRGAARLYNGTATMSASIRLPVVDSYTVDVAFSDVDSRPLFTLIGWDPGVPRGKVSGTMTTTGAEFSPSGRFAYRSVEPGRDILGRVGTIEGRYAMEGSRVSLADLHLRTGLSEMRAEGVADIQRKSLDFRGRLASRDLTDLTSPYYDKLKGSASFSGSITGSFGDPVISGDVGIANPVFEKYEADMINATVVYRKEALAVKEMTVQGKGQSARLSGSVFFSGAKQLFDLANPRYALAATMKNADLGRFARIFYPGFVGSGRLDADLRIGGTAAAPDLGGKGSVEQASLYRVPFDSSSFDWTFRGGKLSFPTMRITRGKSVLTGAASISGDGEFSYSAWSDRLLLRDIVQRELRGDAVFSVRTDGHGTFDNPSVVLDARMVEGTLKGRPVGSGTVHAEIRDRNISVRAGLIGGKVSLEGKGRLEGDIPWESRIVMQNGRYDFIVSSFLKDVPEDLILNMKGTAEFSGDKNHADGSLAIEQMTLSMYGYSFTNENEIRIGLKDKKLSLERISLRSGGMNLKLGGDVEIGKGYNLTAEGSSSLSPFKGLSSRIGTLRGDAEFVLSVNGSWDNPEVNGGVTLTNGSFGLKDYPYRLSSVSGYLYMDNDRVVLQSLSGKLGGGDVAISGIVYLKKFSFKRFYLEVLLKNIALSPSNDFSVNFGGTVLYKGTPASQTISGDVRVTRARYRERIDWKSWLLKTRKAIRYKADISGLEKAELNIRVVGKDSIYIDNNVARATVSADMILRGSVYRPLLFGTLEATDGTVYFRNNEFRVLHARVGFFDPNRINPVVEMACETIVKGYKIKMDLDGQLDHFNVSLSSDPILQESDILSLLTVGQTSGDLKGLEGGIGAGEATSFVTGKLQDVVEERLRTITGLDRFQIDPTVSKTTGTVEPRVTVSKRLLGDKMFVTYSSSIGSAEEQIVRIEYYLTNKISLVGLRDERGIVGGDVRFRFEFK